MFNQSNKVDGYSYYITNDSDEEACQDSDSSEDEKKLDEIDVFLHGTPNQQRKAFQRLRDGEGSSSEDDFEKMMKDELNHNMALHEETWLPSGKDINQPSTSNAEKSVATDTYPDIYFDSDEDDDGDKRAKTKKKKLTNEELFYDPFADDRNQNWINKKRLRGSAAGKEKVKQSVGNADTNNNFVLTCPACLTPLCIDCQRHETYKEQFRAMFAMNCKILSDEVLRYVEPQKKKFKRHARRKAAAESTCEEAASQPSMSLETNDSIYCPVRCEKCDTEVAVYDRDEVYHFFNVIAGPC